MRLIVEITESPEGKFNCTVEDDLDQYAQGDGLNVDDVVNLVTLAIFDRVI